MTLTFLGTGTSTGVPQIGCKCPVCTSADPRDRRRRSGAYLAASGGSLLIDTPPELRLACLEYGIDRVDAVLLTHAHMDHVAGFDDVRRFNTLNGVKVPCRPDDPHYRGLPYRIEGRPLPCLALPETVAAMHHIFPYISPREGSRGLYRPQIEFITADRPRRLCGLEIEAFPVAHGFPCCGFLIDGRLGWFSDCHDLDDATVERLRGVDTMVIDCLREREHPTHLSLARALEYLRRIAPRRAYLTHLCHDLTHRQLLERLPAGIEPAWDGLVVEI